MSQGNRIKLFLSPGHGGGRAGRAGRVGRVDTDRRHKVFYLLAKLTCSQNEATLGKSLF